MAAPLTAKLDNLERAIIRLEGKVDGIVGIFAERGLRLDRVEDEVGHIRSDIGKVKKSVNYGTGFAAAIGIGFGYMAKHALAVTAILALLAEPAGAVL